MADPKVKFKRSSIPGKIPDPTQVPLGEIAINTYDGKVFASKNVGVGTTVFVVNPWSVGAGTDNYNSYFNEGNIGIGTDNPTSKLSVVGDGNFTGVITATSYDGSGVNLTGIVTSIVAGSNITISGSSGEVTINSTASGGGGGGESYWVSTSAGIHTLSNVGIGTTNPLEKLHVLGNLLVAPGIDTSKHITQKAYETDNGTLSWEGSAGQLFSITNNLTTGSIFSVNDISGLPSIDVNANGTVSIVAYGGNLGVGKTTPSTKLDVNGTITCVDINSTSDIKLKENVKNVEDAIEKISKVNGVSFTWKNNKKNSIGVIAQEIEEIFPELVNDGENKSVNYNGLIGVLIEGFKEQQNKINLLESEIHKLKEKLE